MYIVNRTRYTCSSLCLSFLKASIVSYPSPANSTEAVLAMSLPRGAAATRHRQQADDDDDPGMDSDNSMPSLQTVSDSSDGEFQSDDDDEEDEDDYVSDEDEDEGGRASNMPRLIPVSDDPPAPASPTAKMKQEMKAASGAGPDLFLRPAAISKPNLSKLEVEAAKRARKTKARRSWRGNCEQQGVFRIQENHERCSVYPINVSKGM